MGLGVVVGLAPFILSYCSAATQNRLSFKDYIVSIVSGIVSGAIGLTISKRETRDVEETEQVIPIATYHAHRTFYSRVKDIRNYLHKKAL